MLHINNRIKVFVELGRFLHQFGADVRTDHHLNNTFYNQMESAINKAKSKNQWFAARSIRHAFAAWANLLTQQSLNEWVVQYPDFKEPSNPKSVAIIMAGNIPLVGFHDFLSVLLFGHKVVAKMSSDDDCIFPVIKDILIELDPAFKSKIEFTDRVVNPDAVIATGSNNSARYFETYFGKYPNIIRKNRTSVAVIAGNESKEELVQLGDDIFEYYGLGCRNVSKIYVPSGYDLNLIFSAIVNQAYVAQNSKYANNYDYYRAIFMLNKVPFLENGFAIFREEDELHAPISVVHYAYYDDKAALLKQFETQENELQCVVGKEAGMIAFGQTQQPALHDYADGVDTVAFLLKI